MIARFSNGWRLAGQSWQVLKQDRTLLTFPVLAGISATVAFLLLFGPGAVLSAVVEQDWVMVPFLLVAAYAATFATVFFNVALAGAAARSMDGQSSTLSDGIDAARVRTGAIARWSALTLFVGLIISAIQELLEDIPVVGWLVSSLLDTAWAIVTFFVVPVLAFEDLPATDTVKRSGSIIREQWGEGLAGTAAISLPIWLIAFVVGGGAFLLLLEPAPAAAIVIALLVLIVASVLSAALNTIFRVALYRFATGAPAPAAFDQAALSGAFRAK
ncbi:MAG: DUF6159 family protein [Baekduia sp.]